MEKTVLLAKPNVQNECRSQGTKPNCLNCQKLQKQVSELSSLMWKEQIQKQNSLNESSCEVLKSVKNQLLDIKDKYVALKKKVRQVEKENDELFQENTILEKVLASCRAKLRTYEGSDLGNKHNTLTNNQTTYSEYSDHQSFEITSKRNDAQSNQSKSVKIKLNGTEPDKYYVRRQQNSESIEREITLRTKSIQIQLFIEKEKTTKLQEMNRSQSDEIAKLKEYLMKRNNIQSERHEAIQQLRRILAHG